MGRAWEHPTCVQVDRGVGVKRTGKSSGRKFTRREYADPRTSAKLRRDGCTEARNGQPLGAEADSTVSGDRRGADDAPASGAGGR